jgi:hypothetical protein
MLSEPSDKLSLLSQRKDFKLGLMNKEEENIGGKN